MKFLVLGATGMAGHIISIYLKEKGHDVITISRRPFKHCQNIIVDCLNKDELIKSIKEINPDCIINCLGILNDYAEQNKDQAVFINSYIPHLLSEITKNTRTKVIHLSTDCVFSGEKGQYKENDFRDGHTFYDLSKALGEFSNKKDLIFRNSIIGPDMNEKGIGLFNWFMKQNGKIRGYKNAYWNGVTTLQLAKAIEIANDLTGLYHYVPKEIINKLNLLKLFKKNTNSLITIIPYENDYLDKTLINTRKDFCFDIPDYDDMIFQMVDWIKEHKYLYPHYQL